MKLQTLDEMPLDILFETLRLVPNKKNFSVVCKNLYEATWKFGIVNSWMKVDCSKIFDLPEEVRQVHDNSFISLLTYNLLAIYSVSSRLQ